MVLPRLDRRQHGLERGGARRGAQQDVHVRVRGHRHEPLGPGQRARLARRRARCARTRVERVRRGHGRHARLHVCDLRSPAGSRSRRRPGRPPPGGRGARRPPTSALRPIEPVDPRMAILRFARHGCAVTSAAPGTGSSPGTTNSSASMRSSTPPWPGMSAELSLTFALRFSSDSNRSPAMPRRHQRRTRRREHGNARRAAATRGRSPTMAATPATNPPTAPSTLFFGLIVGRQAAPAEVRADVELRGVGRPRPRAGTSRSASRPPRVANHGRDAPSGTPRYTTGNSAAAAAAGTWAPAVAASTTTAAASIAPTSRNHALRARATPRQRHGGERPRNAATRDIRHAASSMRLAYSMHAATRTMPTTSRTSGQAARTRSPPA